MNATTLSERELQIAELVSWGASDKEIASELTISELTAKTHRRNILQKINGHNAADLTRWFFQNKYHISFGINPRTVRHLAFVFLVLIGVSEYNNQKLIRTRTPGIRTSQSRTGRSRNKKSFKLQLS